MAKRYSPETVEKAVEQDNTDRFSWMTWKYKPSKFFEDLKKHNIDKWQIAVREFTKAIY